ncbi:LysR family transcriptional regulator [Bdellovibrio sp. NC01]|uniref:LysR family transcriptional regulator n=1 Tax=Bdellovibrio sp. NC01 TaxID=2220073 RepID=UPI0011581BD4|nr:LysR family transcriptional regulator [Bdellovibrio sp. NC01]QDK38774.1 LysR family transcriptional regulator [Bdellovibrio sp. NC01]
MNSFLFNFNTELLPTFLAVAEAQSLSGAAKLLNLSQPSVTAHIQKLEEELNSALIKRSVTGIQLTEAGHKLLEQARRIQNIVREAAESVSEAKVVKGHLKIAASTTVAAYALPPLLTEFRKRFPQISLELQIGNTDDVLKKLRNGSVPLGLVEGQARASAIHLEPFLEDELLFVCGTVQQSLLRKKEDLHKQTLLLREQGSGTRVVVEKGLKKLNLATKDFNETLDIGSSEAIKTSVMAGLGVAFMSRLSIQNELALGKLTIPFPDLRIPRTFYWAFPSKGLSGTAAEFYRLQK